MVHHCILNVFISLTPTLSGRERGIRFVNSSIDDHLQTLYIIAYR